MHFDVTEVKFSNLYQASTKSILEYEWDRKVRNARASGGRIVELCIIMQNKRIIILVSATFGNNMYDLCCTQNIHFYFLKS